MGVAKTDVLGQRALNRALLERQFLLRRRKMSVEAAIERLVGLQAQSPNAPYVGLWARLESFRTDQLSRLITDRKVVRIALMRSTIHMVSDRDCLMLRQLVQPVLDREMRGSAHGRNIAGIEIDQLVAAGRAIVEERPRTTADLGELLAERWPGHYSRSLAYAIRNNVPLVQVPPRGLWGQGGQPTCTSAESWLGRSPDGSASIDTLILRYLAAFGPATVMDIQAWSGLTKLREEVGRLRPGLRVFRNEDGSDLFDLPDAPRPDPGVPSPPRFLPEFDNLLLSHADRRRVISDDHRKRMATLNGMIPGTILVDGFVAGVWRVRRRRGAATLAIAPYERLRKKDVAPLVAEGERLLEFVAPDADTREVELGPPS
jgi:hypothetical protein